MQAPSGKFKLIYREERKVLLYGQNSFLLLINERLSHKLDVLCSRFEVLKLDSLLSFSCYSERLKTQYIFSTDLDEFAIQTMKIYSLQPFDFKIVKFHPNQVFAV